MARIFLSHSSRDKNFVRRLAEDLTELGHQPWLDEWRIKVGDCIVTGVQEGVAGAQYVVVVLTPEAVASGWVEREWKDAYWTEVQEDRILILPILLRSCDVPNLLRSKKYADFSNRYEIGLAQLAQALLPSHLDEEETGLHHPRIARIGITELLGKIQDRSHSLSRCVAEALSLGQELGQQSLVNFCRGELGGWDEEPGESETDLDHLSYRMFPMFVSVGYLNPSYIGWGESASSMFSYMETHPEKFYPRRSIDLRPVSEIEAQANEPTTSPKAFLHWVQPLSDFNPSAENPEARVHCYARGNTYQSLAEGIRSELTRRLLPLLPPSGSSKPSAATSP